MPGAFAHMLAATQAQQAAESSGGWPGYQPGAALVAEVQRGDDAVQLPLGAGFLGQRINVAVPVAFARLDLFNVARVALRHGCLEDL